MAVTFNPSITNYKPSFTGKQKAPTSSAHVNRATAADSISIAAKPVVKNTLGHRLRNLAFGAMTLVSTAFMGASCEKPIDPPVITPTTTDYSKVPVAKSLNNIMDSLEITGDAKTGDLRKEITYYDDLTAEIKILDFDYTNSTDDVFRINEKNVLRGGTDTGYSIIDVKRTPTRLETTNYMSDATFTQKIGAQSGRSYHMASKKEGLIKSWMNSPEVKITKESLNIYNSEYLHSTVENDIRQIEILDVKYVTKSPKQLKNAVKTALMDSANVAKKAVRTIR